ncbi:MAG: hypothetical protein JSS81_09110 [Acidobacteria bacterium]|nr:hypothetical protein [Acidobacteriota bacterium]
MNDSAEYLRQFTTRLLEFEGALVEPSESSGIEALLPAPLQAALGAPEIVRFGFAAETPPAVQKVSLESDWLEKFERLLDGRGQRLRYFLSLEPPPLSDPEKILAHGPTLQNAVYRAEKIERAWTRYLIFLYRFSAVSDEKREGVISLGLNLSSGSAIDAFCGVLLDAVLGAEGDSVPPPHLSLPPDWSEKRLGAFFERALPDRIQNHIAKFLQGTQKRLDRDLARLRDYYEGLRREAAARLQKQEAARDRLRIEAAGREYESKIADLRQKYALQAEVELVQKLELIAPVQRVHLIVKRRKAERRITIDWNVLTRRLEPPPDEWSYAVDTVRLVCDDASHITHPSAQGPCPQCEKSYCRVCFPRFCPKCRGTAHDR